MCVSCVESVKSHQFFSFPFAQSIWNLGDNWVDIVMVHHILAKNHFHQFCIVGLSKKVILFGSICGLLLYGSSRCIGI